MCIHPAPFFLEAPKKQKNDTIPGRLYNDVKNGEARRMKTSKAVLVDSSLLIAKSGGKKYIKWWI